MKSDTRTPEEKARAICDAKCIAELARQVGTLKTQLNDSELRFKTLCAMYADLKRQYSECAATSIARA